MGIGIPVSQQYGSGRDKELRRFFYNGMYVAMVLAVLLSVGLFIVLPSLAEKGILSLGASGTVATLIGGLTKVLILIA